MEDDFTKELRELLNRHSRENESNTPDFILAGYITRCLEAFEIATQGREQWYGYALQIGGPKSLAREGDVLPD